MPLSPVEMRQKEEYDKVSVEVRRYTATTPEKTIYTIWSLSSPHKFISALAADEISSYLDWCAEIVWDAVLEPKLILLQTGLGRFNMTYQRDLQPLTGVFAREYWLELGRNLGIVHIYYSERRAFIVMALEVPVDNLENARKFVSSFKIETPTTIALKTNRPFIPDAQPSSQQVYSPRDTTQKARLLSRPEPQYTNAARKFHVSGTVVLRAVFSSNGKVTNIRLVSGLPHGLSKASIDAAREIKFTPARRDGQPVSQFIQIEYNYNLY
jgi:TonB family protein